MSSMWRQHLLDSIKPWALLHLGGLCCVGALWLIFGGGPGGLGPYFEAVGEAARAFDRLLLYVVVISLYSALLEVALRVFKRWLLGHKWRSARVAKVMGIGLPALAYAVTHSIYHLPGVLYALCLGTLTAWTYARWRSIRMMAAWHVQWNLLAIAGSILLALLIPGAPRDHMLATYKAGQIARGQIVHREGLGWIDKNHYDVEMYEQVMELMRQPAAAGEGVAAPRLTLRATLTSQWGSRHPLSRSYHFEPHESPAIQRAVACGVTLDFQDFHERQQRELGWWSGLELSAYQRDDLMAAWALCEDQEHGLTQQWGTPVEKPAPHTLIKSVHHTLEFEELAQIAKRRDEALWERVIASRELWRVVDE